MNGFLNSQIGLNDFFFLKPKKIKFEGHGVKARRHREVTDAGKRTDGWTGLKLLGWMEG